MEREKKNEIYFHDFLGMMRKKQHVTLEQVSMGICSVYTMKRIENGERLPEKMMRDRLLSRMGVAIDGYEDYLSADEYERWERRQTILEKLRKKKSGEAKELLLTYEAENHKSVVEEQFIKAMHLMIAEQENAPLNTQFMLAEAAVRTTIPFDHKGGWEKVLLSVQELYLYTEYVRLHAADCQDEAEVTWKIQQYLQIINYIDHSKMDRLSRAKVYPKVAYELGRLVLEKAKGQRIVKQVWECINKAIEMLRNAGRIYYLVELFYLRQKMAEQEEACVLSEEEISDGKEWAKLLGELCKENEVPVHMEDFSYIFWENESYCISDVIRIRRNMLEMSKEQLCEGICSVKTLTRIEQKKTKTQMPIVRQLFERLGLSSDYVRTRVITNNLKTLELAEKLVCYSNEHKTDEWRQAIEELEERLCLSIPQNRQFLISAKTILDLYNGTIEKEQYAKRMIEALECTLPFSSVTKSGEKFYTKEERIYIYNICMKLRQTEGNENLDAMLEICEQYKSTSGIRIGISTYEFFASGIYSYLGDIGEFERSDQLSIGIRRESLSHGRMMLLSKSIYNNLWNYKERIQKNIAVKTEYDEEQELKKCISISRLNKRSDLEKNYRAQLDNLQKQRN